MDHGRLILAATVLAVVAALSTGCAALGQPIGFPSSEAAKEEKPPPVKMVGLWTDSIFYKSGESPTRGFGGRLYFYDRQNNPVEVQGELVVYAYNEAENHPAGKEPSRKYVFTPQQFSGHYRPSKLGPSYSVWIPWDVVGGEQTKISMIPMFTAASGEVVIGEQTKHVLPGPQTVARRGDSPLGNRLGEERSSAIQQVSYNRTLTGDRAAESMSQGPKNGARTTTINIPPSLRDRLATSVTDRSGLTHASRSGPWRPSTVGARSTPSQTYRQNVPLPAAPTTTAPPKPKAPVGTTASSALPRLDPRTAFRNRWVELRSTRFGPVKYPDSRAPSEPREDDRARWQPSLAGRPSATGSSLRSPRSQTEFGASPPSAAGDWR